MFLLLFLFCASFSSAFSVEFYHSDHLGSPSVITDEAGKVVWSADYDTFGDAVNEQGENDIKYNSKEEDKTGLLYYGYESLTPCMIGLKGCGTTGCPVFQQMLLYPQL